MLPTSDPTTPTVAFPSSAGPPRPVPPQPPGRGQRVSGELYAVSQRALGKMDELKGLQRGHYKRLAIDLVGGDDEEDKKSRDPTPAQAYYAHRSYAKEMWKKNGEEGYNCYTEKVARGYVKRKDRSQTRTFLDQIRLFVKE